MSKYSDKAFAISDLIKDAQKKRDKRLKAYEEYLTWQELIDELSVLHNQLMEAHKEYNKDNAHEFTIVNGGSKEDKEKHR